MKVFLDDARGAPAGFVKVETVAECWALLKSGKVETLSLDHDLGEGEPTGYDLVKMMINENVFPKEIIIHTANPVGRENMRQTLKRYAPASVIIKS